MYYDEINIINKHENTMYHQMQINNKTTCAVKKMYVPAAELLQLKNIFDYYGHWSEACKCGEEVVCERETRSH